MLCCWNYSVCFLSFPSSKLILCFALDSMFLFFTTIISSSDIWVPSLISYPQQPQYRDFSASVREFYYRVCFPRWDRSRALETLGLQGGAAFWKPSFKPTSAFSQSQLSLPSLGLHSCGAHLALLYMLSFCAYMARALWLLFLLLPFWVRFSGYRSDYGSSFKRLSIDC